jgi:hypothetical protein
MIKRQSALPLVATLAMLFILPARGAEASMRDAGRETSPPAHRTIVSNTPGRSSDLVDVAQSGDRVYVVWREDAAPPAPQEIRLRVSVDGGLSFRGDRSGHVLAVVPTHHTLSRLRVVAQDEHVSVLYSIGVAPEHAEVWLLTSMDAGDTFSSPLTLNGGRGGSPYPDLAIDDDGNLHLVFDDGGGLSYVKSSDGGISFSAPRRIDTERAIAPQIAARGANVGVVWRTSIGELRFARSHDEGTTFSGLETLAKSADAVSMAWNESVHVLWSDGPMLRHRSSSDGGMSFSPAQALAHAPDGDRVRAPRIAASGTSVRASWMTELPGERFRGPFVRQSRDAGRTFDAARDLSAGLDGTAFGAGAIAGDRVAAWPHTSSGAAPDAEILVAAPNAMQCNVFWKAGFSGYWTDPMLWSTGAVPDADDQVCITAEGTYTVIVQGGRVAGSIVVGDAGNDGEQTLLIQASGLNGNSTLTVANGIHNEGTIALETQDGSDADTTLTITNGVLNNTLSGIVTATGTGGSGSLRRINANVVNDGSFTVHKPLELSRTDGTLLNRNLVTITASGSIAFGSRSVFEQEAGTLDAGGTFLMVTDTFRFHGGTIRGTATLTNASALDIAPEATSAAEFLFRGSPNTISGNLAASQRILIEGIGSNGVGRLIAASGLVNAGTIVLDATGTAGAELHVTSGSLLNTESGLIHARMSALGLTARAIHADVVNRGTVVIDTSTLFGKTGASLTNEGRWNVALGAAMTFGSDAVFHQNGGTLEVGGSFSMLADTFHFGGGAIFGEVAVTNGSTLTIAPGATGAASFLFHGSNTLSGDVASGQRLRLEGLGSNGTAHVTATSSFRNAGLIVLDSLGAGLGNAKLSVPAGTLTNAATGIIDILDSTPGISLRTITANLINHGRINLARTTQLDLAGGVYANHGLITVAPSASLQVVRGTLTSTGAINGGGLLDLRRGTAFTGTGDLTVDVFNDGRLSPGSSPGAINVHGNYEHGFDGTLDIEIGGRQPGTGMDRVNITGAATLRGTLNVSVLPGFCADGTFTFMTFASRSGDFTRKNGLDAGGGRTFVPAPGPTAYELNVTGPACNAAPVANDDHYQTDAGVALNVPSPGVLGNDTDAQNDPLTAILGQAPAHGTVSLQPDGSFQYTPAPSFSGTDSFTYRASDGAAQSGLAAVTVVVTATLPPAINGVTPDSLTVGMTRSLTISGARFLNPRLTFTRGELQIEGNVLFSNSTAIQAEVDLTTVKPGQWTMTVMNQDGATATAAIFIDPAIVFPAFAWEGATGFFVAPDGEVRTNTNYLSVFNVGLTDGMSLVTVDLPSPKVRLQVGASGTIHRGGPIDLIVWTPRHRQVSIPLRWGISPDDISFNGIQTGKDFRFGQSLRWTARGRLGLTAGSGQFSETLGEMALKTGCNALKDAINGEGLDVWKNAGEALIDHIKENHTEKAFTPQELMKKFAEEALERFPLSKVAMAIAECEFELAKEFYESWQRDIDRLSGELCEDESEAPRVQELLARQSQQFNARGAIAANRALLDWAMHLDDPGAECDPPDHEEDLEGYLRAPYDPNDKVANSPLYCRHTVVGADVTCAPYYMNANEATDPIEYTITFENQATATGPAETVLITDVLDADLDPSTLQVVSSSHPESLSFSRSGNVVTFRFDGIDLPPNALAPEGEGWVTFQVKPGANLTNGTEIRNTASIVFDFNPPIATSEVVHVMDRAAPVTTLHSSPLPNAAGWNNGDVTVTLSADDAPNGSGVREVIHGVTGASTSAATTTSALVTIPVLGEGLSTIAFRARDQVGNTEQTQTRIVRVDKTPPSVAIAASDPTVVYLIGQEVAVQYSCSDGASGVSTCSGPRPSGSLLDTATTGSKSFEVSAADVAGNSTSRSFTYRVVCEFELVAVVRSEVAAATAASGASKQAKDALEDALKELDKYLHEMAKTPPHRKTALAALAGAAEDLEAARSEGLIPGSTVQRWLDALVSSAASSARRAIEIARADPAHKADKLADAQRLFDEARALEQRNEIATAIARFRDALSEAEAATKLSPPAC